MLPRAWLIVSLVASVAPVRLGAQAASLPAPLGTRIVDFRLPTSNGATWSLAAEGRQAKAVVAVFFGAECPVSRMYLRVVDDLRRELAAKETVVVGVFSNPQDDAAAVARLGREQELTLPLLIDGDRAVADRFRAERVPEAFVLDGNRVVRYRGRIDDRFGKGFKRPAATTHDLRDAVDAVLAGKPVPRPVTQVEGCPITRIDRKPKAGAVPVTYAKHVAPLIQRHCQGCHRPGEVGPFALMTYKDAAAWAEAIREVVAEKRMPPWLASPEHGKFANDRRLSEAERAVFMAWVEQGCLEGDTADLPPSRTYVKGWSIGTPDEVFAMNAAVTVPAQSPKGGIAYEYILAGKPFAEDRWIEATEVRPGNSAVVHHLTVYIIPRKDLRGMTGDRVPRKLATKLFNDFSDDAQDEPQILGFFVPGDQTTRFPAGVARKVPKGSQLVFEIHYVANGKAEVDRSSIGVVYAKSPPKHEVVGEMIQNWKFAIPPFARAHKVEAASAPLEKDIILRSLNAHMHLRGKSFEFRLALPDGSKETLLSIPKYDFGWQLTYVLAEPRRLPKGARIECTAHFDNSEGNPNNPDPRERVVWGDQTWQEMMVGYFEYYEAEPRPNR
jgi:peroxiredoxin